MKDIIELLGIWAESQLMLGDVQDDSREHKLQGMDLVQDEDGQLSEFFIVFELPLVVSVDPLDCLHLIGHAVNFEQNEMGVSKAI